MAAPNISGDRSYIVVTGNETADVIVVGVQGPAGPGIGDATTTTKGRVLLGAPGGAATFESDVARATSDYVDTKDAVEATARALGDTAARDRANHTGTQSADTLDDGVVNKAFLTTERTKLAGIAAGATVNATDAALRARSSHTGTQTASTISDFSTTTDARISLQKGAASGLAPLGADSKIAAAYLPAYVDDVLEFANLAAMPATGSTGVIYVTKDTNYEYRWSGSTYIQLVASPGTTDAVPEGPTNLYYTDTRATAAANAAIAVDSTHVLKSGDTMIGPLVQNFGVIQQSAYAKTSLIGNATTTAAYLGYDLALNTSSGNVSGYVRLERTPATGFLGMAISAISSDGIRFMMSTIGGTLTEVMRLSPAGILSLNGRIAVSDTSDKSLSISDPSGAYTSHYFRNYQGMLYIYHAMSSAQPSTTVGSNGNWTYGGSLIPSGNNSFTVGNATKYWSNLYAVRNYFNATAYLDGATAGIIGVTGDLALNGSGRINFAGSSNNNLEYIYSANGSGTLQVGARNSISYDADNDGNGNGTHDFKIGGVRKFSISNAGVLTGTSLSLSAGIVAVGDVELTDGNRGVIVKDRTTGTRYRIFMNSGVLSTEAV